MKTFLSLVVFIAVFVFSAIIFYASGLPIERGFAASLWLGITAFFAGYCAMLSYIFGNEP